MEVAGSLDVQLQCHDQLWWGSDGSRWREKRHLHRLCFRKTPNANLCVLRDMALRSSLQSAVQVLTAGCPSCGK